MIIKARQILNLPVFTRSGIVLGKVHDLEINQENYMVTFLVVRKNMLTGPLLIGLEQVIKFEVDKIIVEDLTVAQAEAEIKTAY